MRLIIVLACMVISGYSYSDPWPIMGNPVISRCSNGDSGPCSRGVYYEHSGTVMVDVSPVAPANGGGVGLTVRPVGVHCNRGNALTGDLPFRGSCGWRDTFDHRPNLVGKCELRDLTSWRLTSDSNCATELSWGYHTGAGPGGECVVFTNSTNRTGSTVNTPWGAITAEQAANGGNRFCSKPLPPSVTCEVNLPTIIDHGVMRAGESSKREDDGQLDCGNTPKIDVLVNGNVDSGGVRITATPRVVNPTTVRITSEITVSSSAVAGEHSATYVFVASPY